MNVALLLCIGFLIAVAFTIAQRETVRDIVNLLKPRDFRATPGYDPVKDLSSRGNQGSPINVETEITEKLNQGVKAPTLVERLNARYDFANAKISTFGDKKSMLIWQSPRGKKFVCPFDENNTMAWKNACTVIEDSLHDRKVVTKRVG